ncbi:glycosyl hydrolase family 61-domain-containing protein [Roridomyces roridus]|uniref:AA9 family lytic polysaccharide monooxygenase n=1 Tax=Roridomyces roridus TaxID=1738132 RepID=A0AAD7G0H0_9AGAR|nr:glycosyl hydrolase family 61-domain-containing protein [Roridomyces roridus]
MHSILIAAILLASSSLVLGHGQVNRVTVGSIANSGPNQYWAGDAKNKVTATRVMYQASSPAYVLYDDFTDNSKMSCEGSAKSPAPRTISVAAGQELTVYWQGATGELNGQPGTGSLTAYNPWVHAMGFVFDYITSCNGDCTTFDSTNAGWTKIAHAGIDMTQTISNDLRQTMKNKPEPYYPSSGPGLWAMAKMVQQGSAWNIRIPASLESGQYLIRHELAAVHNPKNSDPTTGPQLYIACIQLDVTNGGDRFLPAGTQSNALYLPNGAFANTNVLSSSFNPAKVVIPGPAIWDGVSGGVVNRGVNTTEYVSEERSAGGSAAKHAVHHSRSRARVNRLP